MHPVRRSKLHAETHTSLGRYTFGFRRSFIAVMLVDAERKLAVD